jgi:hypothetical protein
MKNAIVYLDASRQPTPVRFSTVVLPYDNFKVVISKHEKT